MSAILDCMPGFTFGCDPEVFILNAKGEPVSPDGIIPGTKQEPFKVPYGAVQRDGMAAEFNTDPASTFSDFNRNVSSVLKTLGTFLPEGHTLSIVPSIVFSEEEFERASPEAKELGCSPDFNAWTGDVNPPPSDPENPFLRTASGHLHVGWGDDYQMDDTQHILNCQDLVKQLDWWLGGWSVSLDSDPTRRRLYGKAGAYRPKPYGVEYRVLSNFWITSRDRRLAVWNRMQQAIAQMKRNFFPDKVSASANDILVAYINKAARDKAVESQFRYPMLTTEPSYAVSGY